MFFPIILVTCQSNSTPRLRYLDTITKYKHICKYFIMHTEERYHNHLHASAGHGGYECVYWWDLEMRITGMAVLNLQEGSKDSSKIGNMKMMP